jgi:Skp family chaperone for outer membrane proteins
VETEIENKKRELEEEVDISSDEEEEKPTKDNKKRKMDAFSSNSKYSNRVLADNI